ncbi:hypothetical protein PILCRDRAFT_376828 [Piloderma croceum F 1598]|uniref:Uncharacterized protein n=1 Tax=Piloderma croceum (strain F 1598) TaxID=765440 RepID=A0A0C3FLM1_PILCF|nr:hypothetical protein PILCRDRAFT_376828 [Piloderma croceum F 1598]
MFLLPEKFRNGDANNNGGRGKKATSNQWLYSLLAVGQKISLKTVRRTKYLCYLAPRLGKAHMGLPQHRPLFQMQETGVKIRNCVVK